MLPNPFKPTAGKNPPLLIGRDAVLDDFLEGLEDGPGARNRLMRITGPRGSGKTVLLNALGGIAREHGWEVLDETSGSGLCDRICQRLASHRRVAGAQLAASLPFVKAQVDLVSTQGTALLGELLLEHTEELDKRGAGLLVTIDEVQDANKEDMQTIAQAVQLCIRYDRNIALAFAGITLGVMSIIDGDGMTFLRRAVPEELGVIPISEVGVALRDTFESAGISLAEERSERLAEATGGYAYMIQLVGYHTFRSVRRHLADCPDVLDEDAEAGIAAARRDFDASVIEVALMSLSPLSVEFLLVMSEDDEASNISVIAERMGRTTKGLSMVRQELVNQQVIEPVARGVLGFAIPYLREYLRANREELEARFGIERA